MDLNIVLSAVGDCIGSAALAPCPYGANSEGRRAVGDPPEPATAVHGTIHVIYDATRRPQSLKELVAAADVIVDGGVASTFPGRLWDMDQPWSVETDTLFTVDRVLKGQAETLRDLVVTQVGGKYAQVEVVIDGIILLNPADRHILFLNRDDRGIVPTYSRTDGNFSIVGGWTGNFNMGGGAVKWVSPVVCKNSN
jgi:hypothetical protein